MTKWPPAVALALLAAGCGKSPSSEEVSRSDAADVAAVEAAQDTLPPIKAIMPEPISELDMQRYGLSGTGCSFTSHVTPDSPAILLTRKESAVLKLNGRPHLLAANPGSSEQPFGARAEYAGRAHALHLVKVAADPSYKPGSWHGSVTLTDKFERPVFTAQGTFDCRA